LLSETSISAKKSSLTAYVTFLVSEVPEKEMDVGWRSILAEPEATSGALIER